MYSNVDESNPDEKPVYLQSEIQVIIFRNYPALSTYSGNTSYVDNKK